MDRSELVKNLSLNLRRLRGSDSVYQFAKKLSSPDRRVYEHSYARIESGESMPTLDFLAHIADVLKVTVDHLISPPKQPAKKRT